MGGVLHVGDIKFPDGVSATLEDDVIVVLISEPRVSAAAAEEAAAEAPAEGDTPAEGEAAEAS